MKSSFRILAGISITTTTLGLVGCGGGGASTTTEAPATSLAEQYTASLIPMPSGATEITLQVISPDGTKMAGYYTKGSQKITFRYENGLRKDLDPTLDSLMPRSINNDGLLVGVKFLPDALQVFYAGNMSHTLVPMPDQANSASFVGVDQSGAIYNSYQLNDSTFRSYKLKNGSQSQIKVNGAQNGTLLAMNASGKLAGLSSTNYYVQTSGNSWTQYMQGMQYVMPASLNQSGIVVGTNKNGSYNHAFINDGTNHANFGEPNSVYSVFESISEGGIAVGCDILSNNGNNVQKAFAWSKSTGYTDLNTRIVGESNFVAGEGTSVSNNGVIVGWGKKNGVMVGMILTPVQK